MNAVIGTMLCTGEPKACIFAATTTRDFLPNTPFFPFSFDI